MGTVTRAPEAQSDIDQIADYISRENSAAAFRWLDSLEREFGNLARFPGMGRQREEIRPGLRSLPFGSYVIDYKPIDGGIVVVRVVHGRRDVGPLF